MKETNQEILIEKQLRGVATDAERQELQTWRGETAANEQYFSEIEKISRITSSENFQFTTNTDSEWRKLQRELGTGEARVVQMKPRFTGLKIAAAIIAFVAVGWLLMTQFGGGKIGAEYATARGETETIELSDGTKVFLNADSKLAVMDDFAEENRTVQLEGEAFFEVAKNEAKPFLIQTGKVTTRVVGTAFNIEAYPEMEVVEINVTEGIVEFSNADEKLRLTAEKAAQFNKESGKIWETAFDQDEVSWKNGSLVFKNESMTKILQTLERRYDVQIVDRSGSEQLRLTEVVDKDEPIENVLNRLRTAANLTLKKEGSNYVFEKK